MRVLELRGGLDLAAEADPVQLGDDLPRENLDDDFSRCCPVDRDEHATHTAATELALDSVGPGQLVFHLL